MICKELIIDFLADYLDGTLTPDILADLERHLQNCPPCMAYLNTYRKIPGLADQAARAEMPEEMKARLREFLLKQLTKPQA